VIVGVLMSRGEDDLKIEQDVEIDVKIDDYEISDEGLDTGASGELNKRLRLGEIDIDLGEVGSEAGEME
jgi:hypothetical protein